MRNSFSKLQVALAVTVAAAAFAAPAQARDGSLYAGVGVGYTDPEAPVINSVGERDVLKVKDGWEGEAFVGYDFGAIRTEFELAYASFKQRSPETPIHPKRNWPPSVPLLLI